LNGFQPALAGFVVFAGGSTRRRGWLSSYAQINKEPAFNPGRLAFPMLRLLIEAA